MNNRLTFKGKTTVYYLFLLLVLFLAYLPLTTFYWGMKNDAFSVNFPNKLFFTQALHSGHFPLWNPYLNFGFPIYADPGFAFWNPITWLFGIIGYNAYTLTFEVLLYIYLAGFFMFRLCKYLCFSNEVSFLTGCLYMCCGFFPSHVQHINFISCAPFIPLMLQGFLRLQMVPSYHNAFFYSIACYFVFASGHPAMPLASVYFLLSLFLFINTNAKDNSNLGKLVYFHLLTILFLLFALAPAIYSYLNILPVYARNMPVNIVAHLYNDSFDLKSIITFLFPFTSTAKTGFFVNDESMRNCYFSITGLIAFGIGMLSHARLVKAFYFTGFIMLLLSCGGVIKTFLFNSLPGFSYIKTNGEFRVFGIFCFCMVAACGVRELFNRSKRAFLILIVLLNFFLAVSIVSIMAATVYHWDDWIVYLKMYKSSNSLLSFIKTNISHLPFSLTMVFSNILCIIICTAFSKKRVSGAKKIIYITLADIIINTIIVLPAMSTGATSLSQIQTRYENCRNAITAPRLVPLNQLKEFDATTTGLLGSYSYYDNNIGTRQLTGYPSYFNFTEDYFNSAYKDSLETRPFIFLQHDSRCQGKTALINITKFSPQEIALSVDSPTADTLILLQNHYKYWHCHVNSKEIPITTAYASFMAVPVTAGTHTITFTYKDPYLLICCMVSFCFILSHLIFYSYIKVSVNKLPHYNS